MSSLCDPAHAPVGDVGMAIMAIDSRLKAIHGTPSGPDSEQQQLTDRLAASLSPEEVDDVVDGMCTLVYVFMRWLRVTYEEHDKDVIEYVVPGFVASMRMMPRSIPPETIPTMTGLVVAAGTGLSPNLWRKQYGDWTENEMSPLEATALLLAEHINRLTDDRDFATRMVTEALSATDPD
ncbi:hypothetical protein ACFYW1_23045 [Streptomyces sp. NPDC002669]|uniref:hypothetical protein n=1 Tax=Streptomyces sp. NPDC002669 TaxID=3364658 RepID=UPI0036A0010B